MRAWILLFTLVGCVEALHPSQQPSEPVSVSDCRSTPTTLNNVKYDCGSYEIVDATVAPISIRAVVDDLVRIARGQGAEAESRAYNVEGAEDAMLIELGQRDGRAFDIIVMNPTDTKARMIQCHVPWFTNESSRPLRERICVRGIRELLTPAAPAGKTITADCARAAERLPTLPGRVNPPDDSERLRAEVRNFAARCTDKVAACALAASTYAEATICY